MTAKNMDKDSPILARIFKEEAEMEVWKKTRDGEYALLKTYPICKWSGDLGPKKKVGDRQAPEGFYTITPGQMNPNSNYYLAFNTGFPNAYDRAWGYTGSDLMVHGDCSSRGCYAMTDEQIQEIYALARESFFGGQKAFQLQAYPFRMTAMNMAKHRNNPNFAFWKMLKEGYDHFNASHQEPKVAVCEKRYVFDAAPPDDSTRPLSFNAKSACPVYQLDPTIADAVHEERRQEQLKMAQYIASGVSTVAFRVGDGGMNPVFMAKLPSSSGDNNGRLFELTSAPSVAPATVPGALPRTPNRGAVTLAKLQSPQQPSGPATVASVPMPHPAPQPKEGETPAQQKPTSIAGLIGNLFGGSKSEAAPAPPPPQKEQVAARSTDLAAKPKQAAQCTRLPRPCAPHRPGRRRGRVNRRRRPRRNQPQRPRLRRSLLRFNNRPKSRRRVRKFVPPIRPRLRATTACSPVPSRWSPPARSRPAGRECADRRSERYGLLRLRARHHRKKSPSHLRRLDQ